jgi:chromosomal replication initiation ATPase DnaA
VFSLYRVYSYLKEFNPKINKNLVHKITIKCIKTQQKLTKVGNINAKVAYYYQFCKGVIIWNGITPP